ncbi:hypothetical protein FBY24_2338 [Cellulomonas sp. SLBN-39]|nr:hypothetical protein FBY24_2338 [Cellulomonas sp. SLBN-39]
MAVLRTVVAVAAALLVAVGWGLRGAAEARADDHDGGSGPPAQRPWARVVGDGPLVGLWVLLLAVAAAWSLGAHLDGSGAVHPAAVAAGALVLGLTCREVAFLRTSRTRGTLTHALLARRLVAAAVVVPALALAAWALDASAG